MRFISSILFLALTALISTEAFADGALYTVRDCSIASMSGASQSLLSGTSFNRKYLLICNNSVAGDTVGVNLAGGTAVISGSSLNLAPGACKEFATGSSYLPNPPSNAITLIGTSGQPVGCYEGK